MSSSAFAIERRTLVAGESTPIYPNYGQMVTIGNGTSTDLLLYSSDGDELAFLSISAGYERDLRVSSFQVGQVAFWLKSSVGGAVTLIWA